MILRTARKQIIAVEPDDPDNGLLYSYSYGVRVSSHDHSRQLPAHEDPISQQCCMVISSAVPANTAIQSWSDSLCACIMHLPMRDGYQVIIKRVIILL